jgi:hypothetical protein
MKKLVLGLMLVAMAAPFATPALAQKAMEQEMERRRKANEEADRGYQTVIKNTTPEKQTKVDPWAKARSADPATTGSEKK